MVQNLKTQTFLESAAREFTRNVVGKKKSSIFEASTPRNMQPLIWRGFEMCNLLIDFLIFNYWSAASPQFTLQLYKQNFQKVNQRTYIQQDWFTLQYVKWYRTTAVLNGSDQFFCIIFLYNFCLKMSFIIVFIKKFINAQTIKMSPLVSFSNWAAQAGVISSGICFPLEKFTWSKIIQLYNQC